MQIFTYNEKLVLTAAIKSLNGSLLSLRRDTRLSVDDFVAAVQILEQKNALTRTGLRYEVSASSLKWFAASHMSGTKKDGQDYLATISAPQLSIYEFFIPNRESFLKDLKQSR